MENKVILEILKENGSYESKEIEIGSKEDFSIDEENIEKALCSSGSELYYYGTLAADLKAQTARKKSNLEAYDAELALTIRSENANNMKRITEGFIQEKIKSDKTHINLFREWVEAERGYNKVENLFRSQQKRADCAIAMAYSQRVQWKNP